MSLFWLARRLRAQYIYISARESAVLLVGRSKYPYMCLEIGASLSRKLQPEANRPTEGGLELGDEEGEGRALQGRRERAAATTGTKSSNVARGGRGGGRDVSGALGDSNRDLKSNRGDPRLKPTLASLISGRHSRIK